MWPVDNVTSLEKAVKVNIAADRVWTNDAGMKETRTDWITVTVFDEQAAWIKDNLSTGQPVIAEGRINNSSYEKDGQTVYTTDLVGDDVQRVPGQHECERLTEPVRRLSIFLLRPRQWRQRLWWSRRRSGQKAPL